MAVFDITRWPWWLVFVLAGAAGAVFAFVTVNLFTLAMASLAFIQEFKWVAIRHGALWQVAELFLWGSFALACWLVFKFSEHELEGRYRAWSRRRRARRREPAPK